MDKVKDAVSLLQGRISADLPVVVGRDRRFLSAVASSLDLDGDDPLQQAQVATLLSVMGVSTSQEYPKWVTPEGADKPVLVQDEHEESNLMGLPKDVPPAPQEPAPQEPAPQESAPQEPAPQEPATIME